MQYEAAYPSLLIPESERSQDTSAGEREGDGGIVPEGRSTVVASHLRWSETNGKRI